MRKTRSFAATVAAATATALAVTQFASAVTTVKTKKIATGFNFPTFVTHAPGDASRLFVLEKRGVIKIVDLPSGAVHATPFLDIDAAVMGGATVNDEQGLLGLAFHPDYQHNGYFYVYYTAVAGGGDDTIARYKVSADPDVATAGSGKVVLQWDDPFSNHNGGWMGFGPDGQLYISVGDGGSANDPGNRAQDITDQKLGKILRITPNATNDTPPMYTSPTSNPFYGVVGDDEIWAYGVRNPWRCSFDRLTGDFWMADVGQGAVEEIDFQPAGIPGGRNYGWRCKEGNSCTGLTGCTCADPTLTGPIHTYTHATGVSITGGYVYRGCAYPELQGTYFFADYGINHVWSFRYNGTSITEFTDRLSQITPAIDGTTVNQIAAFGEDANGELYIVDHGSTTGGQIFKIVPASGEVTCPAPVACVGDFNHDGVVNGTDIPILLGFWGLAGGDLDGDRTTGPSDLALVLANWGACP